MALPLYDNSNSVHGSSVSSVTIPAFTVAGTNRLIWVGVATESGTDCLTTSVVRNTTETFTEEFDLVTAPSGNETHVSGHHFIAPATGSYSIVVTVAATQESVSAGAVSLTDVHQTDPVGTPVTASGTGTTPTVTVTGTTADELVIDAVSTINAAALTAGADQTSRWEQEADGASGCSTQPGDTSGGVMSWSISSTNWAIGAVPLRSIDYVAPTGIRYVGGQVAGFAGKTTDTTVTFALTGGLASVPAAGDLVVVSYHVGGTTNKTLTITNAAATPYDYLCDLYQDDTYDSNLRVAYRFMPGTPETSLILSQTFSTADAGRYTIHVFRNVDSSTPIDVASVEAGGINTRIAHPGNITPVTAGAWIYCVGGAAAATGGTFTTATLSAFLAGTTSDTVDSQIGAGYYDAWTSGEYDPAVFGGGGTDTTNDSWTALTVALRPAVPTGGGGVSGAFAQTLGALVLAATCAVGVGASAAPTLGALTCSGAATVAVSASGSPSLGAITASGAGAVGVSGALSGSLGALTASGGAAVTAGPVGALAQSLGALTGSGGAAVSVAGAGAASLGALTGSAAAGVAVSGAAAPTLGALTASGAASVLNGPAGVLSSTLGVLTASGVSAVSVAGASTPTLGALTGSGSGAVSVAGSGAASLGALTGAGTSSVAVSGAAGPTLGALTSSGSSAVAVAATSTPSLGALTLSGSGAVASVAPATGVLSSTLGALTASGAGTVVWPPVIGTINVTLGSLTDSGAGAVGVSGAATPTLGALTLSGVGAVTTPAATGTLGSALGALTCAGTATVTTGVPVSGDSSPTLGALTLSGAGTVAVTGNLSVTLGGTTTTTAPLLYRGRTAKYYYGQEGA